MRSSPPSEAPDDGERQTADERADRLVEPVGELRQATGIIECRRLTEAREVEVDPLPATVVAEHVVEFDQQPMVDGVAVNEEQRQPGTAPDDMWSWTGHDCSHRSCRRDVVEGLRDREQRPGGVPAWVVTSSEGLAPTERWRGLRGPSNAITR